MNFFRLMNVLRIAGRYRLDTFFPHTKIATIIRIFFTLHPSCWGVTRRYDRGERLRLALEKLGPIFVKFGQILSTRRDLLPIDIADELAKLQDQVTPFASEEAIAIIEHTYGKTISQIFQTFSFVPLASASIAQVHAAILPNGEDVVVKIVRPNIYRAIAKDVSLLYSGAKWLKRLWKDSRRLRPTEVVAEFEKTLFDELDMQREAANAAELRRNFMDSPIIYVPKVYFDYTHKNILVMERVYGVRISDMKTLRAKNVNMEKLARYGVEIFMTQVFRDSFFHADMHPGNIFVDVTDPENPKYCAIDFGIMGMLSKNDQRYLAENFLAFFNRDYRRIAELHIESQWVPVDTNLEDFEAAIRTVLGPIFQKPLNEISFAQLLLSLFQTARRFNMEIQPQLILLQKTLLNIEGLGRELYPQLDLWDTVQPFLKNWMRERYSPKTVLKEIVRRFPNWMEKLPEMPERIYNYLNTDDRGLQKKIADLELQAQKSKLQYKWLIGSNLVLAAILIALIVI